MHKVYLDDFSVISASLTKTNNHCVKGRYFLWNQTIRILVLISSCSVEAPNTKKKPLSLEWQQGTDPQGVTLIVYWGAKELILHLSEPEISDFPQWSSSCLLEKNDIVECVGYLDPHKYQITSLPFASSVKMFKILSLFEP